MVYDPYNDAFQEDGKPISTKLSKIYAPLFTSEMYSKYGTPKGGNNPNDDEIWAKCNMFSEVNSIPPAYLVRPLFYYSTTQVRTNRFRQAEPINYYHEYMEEFSNVLESLGSKPKNPYVLELSSEMLLMLRQLSNRGYKLDNKSHTKVIEDWLVNPLLFSFQAISKLLLLPHSKSVFESCAPEAKDWLKNNIIRMEALEEMGYESKPLESLE